MDSPFSAKLGTNYSPEDEEILEIQAFLVEPTLRLNRLDDKIAELEQAIQKLKEERKDFRAFVDAHKALVSPVRRLPIDIIQEIFLACLPTNRNCAMSAFDAPLLLGRICSSWRTISLSTPPLWTTLHIVNPSVSKEVDATQFGEIVALRLAAAKMWLKRSAPYPLSISLKSGSSNHSEFSQLLSPFAARWQHIHFMTPPAALEGFFHLTETDVPLLETVLIDGDKDTSHGFWGSLGILRAARMSEFSIPGRSFVAEAVPLRWHQLETLILAKPSPSSSTYFSNEAAVQAISRCPNLRCCKLWLSDELSHPAQSRLPMVELVFLHTLELHNSYYLPSFNIPFMLEHLSAPNLHRLTLDGASEVKNPHPLLHFLAVSTRLEELDLDTYSIPTSSLFESIRRLPDTMQRLVIRRSGFSLSQAADFDDSTLDLLVPGAPDRAFCCPALKTLIIEGSRISDPALLRFILARVDSDGGSTLRKVLLHFDRRRTMELDLRLAPFMEAGLQLCIIYSPTDSSKLSPWCGMKNPYPPTRIISQSLAARTSGRQIGSFIV
ncbi:hypothetical protein B0H16DRAFT_1529247 [Mycena metata]|uniref:F-box domain-containing protein n=1 Tax=Mycena metata TaxID=1033252 RepID=A0AAD7JG37_9AGAR|nr:hypothetical protein B0H16DRAFT_1529247 [Mycena metata]